VSRPPRKGPAPLTRQQALEALRGALVAGTVFTTRHIRERMVERLFDMNDILYVSKHGAIRRPPELDIKRGNYTYVVEGTDTDGKKLEIVFSVGNVGGGGEVTLITGRRP
jgi:Domain of unknown function (DUF4258)